MRYEYRITKYNPKFRDGNGNYIKDEWTAYSDIGNRFSGKLLTEKEYHGIESAYIKSVESMLLESEIKSVIVQGLEKKKSRIKLKEGQVIVGVQISRVCKSILREKIWAKLYSPRHGFIHFGYDNYMYVGLSRNTPKSLIQIKSMGLFCEEYESPYK